MEAMVEQPTQELSANALVEFQDECSDFSLFLNYAMTTLKEVKEKYLDNSVRDLGTCWEKIHDMLVLQFTVIQTTFGQSVTLLEHRFKDVTLYSGLGGHVSR